MSIQPRLEIPVLKPGSKRAVLRRGSLPGAAAPGGRARALPPPDARAALARGARRARARAAWTRRRARRLDRQTFGGWLARHGQGPDAVSALWDLIALPTLNLPAAQASLALGAFVFRNGLLSGADAGDIGFHSRDAQRDDRRAGRAGVESRAGVEVRLGWRAERLRRTARDRGEAAGAGRRARGCEAGCEGRRPADELES